MEIRKIEEGLHVVNFTTEQYYSMDLSILKMLVDDLPEGFSFSHWEQDNLFIKDAQGIIYACNVDSDGYDHDVELVDCGEVVKEKTCNACGSDNVYAYGSLNSYQCRNCFNEWN